MLRPDSFPRAMVSRWRKLVPGLALGLALAGSVAAADPKASRFYEDALVRFEQKDFAGSIVQLKNALQVDRQMLPVHALLGRALLETGAAAPAEVALTEALRLGVDRAELIVPLATSLMQQGKQRELLEDSRFALVGLPVRTRYELGLIRSAASLDLGDPAAAEAALKEARALQPGDVDSWIAEVQLRIRAGQPALARAAAERALLIAPTDPDAHYARGEADHVRGNLAGATAAYGRTLELEPDHVDALVARAGVAVDQGRREDAARDIAALARVAPQDPRGRFLFALTAEREGRMAESRAALNEVTALLDPVPPSFLRYRPQLLMLGGLAHYGLGQREKAKPYLEAVLKTRSTPAAAKLLANIHLADRNPLAAVQALEIYLRAVPHDTQAQLLMASALMSQGNHLRASQLMQDALRGGENADMRTALGMSLVGRGLLTDAVKELEAALQADPGQLQAGYALASLRLQSGQTAAALRTAEALLARFPDNLGVLNLVGAARQQGGDSAGARAAFDKAASLDPGFLPARVSLARLDMAAGAAEAAGRRLDDVLKVDAKYLDALSARGELNEAQGELVQARRWYEAAEDSAGRDNAGPAIALVDFHLRHGQADLAREAIKRASGKDPDGVQTLLAIARVALAQADADTARSALTRASNSAVYSAPLLTRIALLQVRAGHLPGALYTVDKALSERPDYLPAIAARADIDLRLGELDAAEQQSRRMVALAPRLGVGHAGLGDVAVRRGQSAAALQHYRRAHELDQSADSLVRLFRATFVSDRAAAVRLIEQWVRAHPDDAVARRMQADTYLVTGDLKGARAAYQALLKLRPRDPDAMNNLANVLIMQRDPGALQVAEQALALNPDGAHIIGTAGWAAFKAGQTDRAVQLLRDARLRDPSNADTRYFLGMVLAQIGRAAEARTELTAALASTAGLSYADEAREALRTLR